MRISVEPWAADYGAELDLDGPDGLTQEPVDVTVEGREWSPVTPGDIGALASLPLAFIDGTRRVDARMFLSPNGGPPTPGLAGSVGVGAVICDPGPPGVGGRRAFDETRDPARCAELRIDRLLAAGDGLSLGLSTSGGLDYKALPVPGRGLEELLSGIHEAMRAREAALALELADDHLVFLDGPFAVMRPGPARVVAVIKSHQRRYLEESDEAILGELRCGERTPLFAFGEPRPRYSWYVRMCDLGPQDHDWHGLIRCEAPSALAKEDVVALADASAWLLPAFASAAYWDARAPQNMVPVAGLERRLRHLLGDRELVYRMIRSAAHRASEGAA